MSSPQITPASILFTAWEGGGNVAPVLGVAARMVKRGHPVTVLTEPCLEQAVRNIGADFLSFRKHFVRQDRRIDLIQDSKPKPLAIPAIENILLKPALDVAHETIDILRSGKFSLVVADCMMPGALFAAEQLNYPRVALFHMPEYLPGPNRPPGGMGLLPARNGPERLRQKLVTWLFHRVINQYLAPINAVRGQLGLSAYASFTDIYHQADLRLIQTCRAFDIPIDPPPANVRYVGPVLDEPVWVQDAALPFDPEDPLPLIVVSLSSTFQNQKALLQRIINAVSGKPLRCLVTLGPAMADESFTHGSNVILTSAIPHSRVFPHARAVITHAGHSTVMKALSFGLPMVCIPMGRDQNDNAALVQHHGAGFSLGQNASASQIFSTLQKVLNTPAFQNNAQRLQQEILNDAHSDHAELLLEQLMERRQNCATTAPN